MNKLQSIKQKNEHILREAAEAKAEAHAAEIVNYENPTPEHFQHLLEKQLVMREKTAKAKRAQAEFNRELEKEIKRKFKHD